MVHIVWIFYCINFLLFLHKGSSLNCYSCSASVGHNSACETMTDRSSYISHQECHYNNAVCATYKISDGSDTIMYRSCKSAEICVDLAKKFNSEYNQLLDCHTCDDNDFCNSGYKRFPWISLVILSVLSSILSILLY